MSDLRSQIIDKAREYIGTPFHLHARVKHIGIDCVGLIYCVLRDCGVAVKDHKLTTRDAVRVMRANELNRMLSDQLKSYDGIPRIGDVISTWAKDRMRRASHAGFYTGRASIIHAIRGPGVVEQTVDRSKITGVFIVPGCE